MRKSIVTALVVLSSTAFAQGSGIKPGLWEVRQIKQVMDGHDMAAEMAAAQAQMQQSLANLPPEQRKQMEAMMGKRGAGAGGGTRICISPAMAARDKPMVDPEGRCEPAKMNRSGNTTRFEFNCTHDGRTTVGKGESTVTSDLVRTRMDMTVSDASGRHTMQSESEMKFLGADCQGVLPADQMVKGMRGTGR